MGELDVIIATHNPELKALERAFDSAKRCDEVQCVIIVDDGSDEPVRAQCDVTIRHANAGPSAARNTGIEQTQSPFVLFLDDDDELVEEGISASLELIKTLGACAGVGARYEIDTGSKRSLNEVPAEWAGRVLPCSGDVFRPIRLFNTTGMIVSRRVLDAGVRFDEDLRIGEDRDFLCRVGAMGAISVCPQAVAVAGRRADGANLTAANQYARRVRDHLVLLERHCDAESEHHFKAATIWLINAIAKSGANDESWRLLLEACQKMGWRVPIKARLRHARGRRVLP